MTAAHPRAERAVRVVLFDLDGVLTTRDTFATVVTRRLLRSPWRLALALPALPVLAATGALPAVRGRASRYLVRVALCGISLEEAGDVSRAVGLEFAGDPGALRPAAITAARRHLDTGDRVVVVTATEEGLARVLLDAIGLDAAELVASRLTEGRVGTGIGVHNYGRRKVDSLSTMGIPHPWAVMYSDSWADAPLLDRVERPVLVDPSPRLLARGRRRWAGRLEVLRDKT